MRSYAMLMLPLFLSNVMIGATEGMYVGLSNHQLAEVGPFSDMYRFLSDLGRRQLLLVLILDTDQVPETVIPNSEPEVQTELFDADEFSDRLPDIRDPGLVRPMEVLYDDVTDALPGKRTGKRFDCRGFKFGVWQRKMCQKVRSR